MLQNTCSVCGEKFEDHYFDKEQTKCILHCEKNDLWGNENKYNPLFVELFIEFIKNGTFKKLKINNKISSSSYFISEGYILFIYVVFPSYNDFLKIFEIIGNKKILFEQCTFFSNIFKEYKKFDDLVFRDCIFYEPNYGKENYVESSNLYFDNIKINSLTYGGLNAKHMTFTIEDSDLLRLVLKSSLVLEKTRVSEELMIFDSDDEKENFNQVVIDKNCFIQHIALANNKIDLLSIKDSTIDDELFLANSKMASLNIQNSTLKNGLNLNNTTLKDRLSLINSRIETKKLDLSNTSLPSSTNFLNAKFETENRETARIIKNSFEQQNNIIEANKYYALEMKHYDNELNWKDNLKEKLIFKFHDWSSEHSQNWVLPLLLILLLSIIYGTCEYLLGADFKKYPLYANILSFLFIVLSIPFMINNVVENKNIKHILSAFIFLSFGIYFYITKDVSLELLAKAINPFSSMKSNESINGIQLIFKIVIAYLIYQFITSVRQNTRRK